MDQRLLEAIARNDRRAFMSIVGENEEILQQRAANSSHTVLHLASRFGHFQMVTDIVKLRPDMVAAENSRLETPLHEACRQGNLKVAMLLIDTNPWAACKLNSDRESALFMACSHGHLKVVEFLLSRPWMRGLVEDDFGQNCLHVAVTRGHTGTYIVDFYLSEHKLLGKFYFNPVDFYYIYKRKP
jgi:ankyrin repeat protein